MEYMNVCLKIMKTCLVTRGYEEDSHHLKTDSPTCNYEAAYYNVNSLVYDVASRESGFPYNVSTG